jgi:hypothetical protein
LNRLFDGRFVLTAAVDGSCRTSANETASNVLAFIRAAPLFLLAAVGAWPGVAAAARVFFIVSFSRFAGDM